jgi:hypothetical protein
MALFLEGALAQFAEAVEEEARASVLWLSPLLRMLPLRRRCSGLSNQSSIDGVHSILPISRNAQAPSFC